MDCDKTIDELQNLEAIAFGYSENGGVFGMDCSDFEQIMTDTADLIRELLERAEKAERERDAAVRDLRERAIESCSECNDCLYRTARSFCTDCNDGSNWKWRGVQEE